MIQSLIKLTTYLTGILFLFQGCTDQGGDSASETKKKDQAQKEEGYIPPEVPSMNAFKSGIAFVPSISEGTVSAIDLNTNQRKWKIKVSEGTKERKAESAMGIAATKDGKWVYTGDVATQEVVIIDAENQKIHKRIPLDHKIHAIDICPHSHWVWVAGQMKEYPWLTSTTIINVQEQKKEKTLSPAIGRAAHFGWTPDAKEVWAASISNNTLFVWDAREHKVTDVIPLHEGSMKGKSPESEMGLIGFNEVTISPDGRRAFAVGPEAGIVYAVNVQTKEPIGKVKVGDRTHGVAVSRDGKEVWTANNAGTVTILGTKDLEVKGTVDLSEYAEDLFFAHIGFSLDGKKAYVSLAEAIAVIDVATRKVEDTITFGHGTHEISLEDYFVQAQDLKREVQEGTAKKEDPQDQEKMTRVSEKSGITIEATYKAKEGKTLTFHIAMNTHSGDLMTNDLTKQSVLRLNDQQAITSGFSWKEGEGSSSHHRKGTLSIDVPAKNIHSIELEITEVGVPSRKFKWDFQS